MAETNIISKFHDPLLKEYTLGYKSIKETNENKTIILKLIKRNILKYQSNS